MKHVKIHICGPSGTGKTTLAKELSRELGLHYVTTSAKVIWPKYGATCHSDVLNLGDNMFHQYQLDILSGREEALSKLTTIPFITDRSPIDNLVYTVDRLKSAKGMEKEIDKMFKEVKSHLSKYVDLLIYLPFTEDVDLEDDNLRISSRLYQELSGQVFDIAIHKWYRDTFNELGIPVKEIVDRNLPRKVEYVKNVINGKPWKNLKTEVRSLLINL